MKRLLPLLIIALFLLPILPTTLVLAAPLTTQYINLDGYHSYIAYTKTSSYAAYAYGLGSAGGYDVVAVITDNTGNIVRNETLNANVNYGEVDIAGNDTGFLIAYRYYVSGGKKDDIYLIWLPITGSPDYIGRIMVTAAKEDTPVVAFGSNYWLVGFTNYTAFEFTVRLYDLKFTQVFEQSFSIGQYGGVDYRERAFYDPVTGKFYVVVRAYNSATSSYDLALVIVDPSGPSATMQWITSTSGADEAYPSYGRMYPRFYAQLLEGGGKLLVVYGYRLGSTNIDGVIVDLSTLTTTSVVIDTEGGDSNVFPWIAASSSEWLVVWTYNGNLYARFVYPDGTTSDRMTLGTTVFGYATAIYYADNNYTIVYGNQSTGDYDLYAITITTDGRLGSPYVIAKTAGENEDYEYPLYIGTKLLVLYTNEAEGKEYLAIADISELPEPSKIPTKLTVSLTKNDLDSDTYLEAGESITLSGYLRETTTGTGISGKTITATLYRYNYYDSVTGHDEQFSVATGSDDTDATGYYEITINIPSDALSSIYFVIVSFAGDSDYAAQSNSTEYFFIFHTAPATITWATIPTAIADGPAILFTDGQVIITDPAGDERTYPDLGTENADMDIRSLQLAIDTNYLYVKATFNGTVGEDGSYTPVLGLVFDFTPDDKTDGAHYNYTDNFDLSYPWDSDTHVKDARGWDIAITLTPVQPKTTSKSGPEIIKEGTRYMVIMYVAYYDGSDWNQYKEIGVGYAEYSGSTITAYIPLDIIRNYNTHLKDTGIQRMVMYSAVFPVEVSTGKIVSGIPYANWYDVPGALVANASYTPATYLNQGYNESYRDDRKTYGKDKSYELDTEFRLNVDWSTEEFFSYAVAYITTVNETFNANEYSYDFQHWNILSPGTNEYVARIVDLNNTIFGIGVVYGIYGVTLDINGTTGTSDAIGFTTIAYQLTDETKVGSNDTLTLSATLPTGYRYTTVGLPKNYKVKVVYFATVSWSNVNLNDVNGNGVIDKGDTLHAEGTVTVRKGDDSTGAPAVDVTIKIVIWSHSVILGTATASAGTGTFTFDYTFQGGEGILGSGHNLTAYGDEVTTFITDPNAIKYDITGYIFSLPPAPELPVLPVVLLAAVLLMILLKKRK